MHRAFRLPSRLVVAIFALLACLLVAPAAVAATNGGLEAKITRQKQGIPTIEAGDYKSLGFGYGYVMAQDEICTLADSYLTSQAVRSRYFGADAKSPEGFTNLDSDLFYQQIRDQHTVEDLMHAKGKQAIQPEVKRMVKGYVKGYNAYLKKTGVAKISDPTCAGKPWVKPITTVDAYRRFYELTLYGSSGVAIDGISEAQPPNGSARPTRDEASSEAPAASEEEVQALGDALDFSDAGSNGWGLGSDATKKGGGILLANPHFPWQGPRRFYQAHLVIQGELNVSGASLLGSPVILIGHNQKLAWTHTVSTAYRFTPFQLKLAPGDPTSYLVDGEPVAMDRHQVTVQVKQADGSLAPVSRTLYSTRYGPVTTRIADQSLFDWTNQSAFALFDANAHNFRLLNHFFDTDRADSTKELLRILKKYQGIPWVNTIASDSKGRAFYADIGSIPNVSNDKAVNCGSSLGGLTFPQVGLPVLDGSRSECAMSTDPDSAAPGIMGASKEPFMFRRDYVANSNDSYWLTNAEQPLEGYPRIIGSERTQRSLRTRLGLLMIIERLAGSDGLAGNKFTRKNVQTLVFQNRQYAGELWRDQLVAYCNAHPTMNGSSGPVDVSEACAALANWDLHVDLDSRGALLFTRFLDRFGASTARFANPFQAADPVNTPNGLNTSSSELETALADAVTDLRSANIPLDAPYGQFHWEPRGSERIPIHGGEGEEGVFNAISDVFTPGVGFDDITHGSSFVMVTSFEKGCPKDRSILTYSLSENRNSKHYSDQTRMFSQKKWVDPPFCPREVEKTAKSVKVLRGN